MMPGRASLLLSLALTAGATGSLAAQADTVEVGGGALFLLIPVGGRATALGQAAVADGGTGESAFWNPAGLALLDHAELNIHYARTFASNNTVLAAYLASPRLGVAGVAAYLVDYGSQPITPGPGDLTGRIALRNIEVIASYATPINSAFAVGVNYKFIQFRHDCSGACELFPTAVGTTHGVDVGVQAGIGETDALRLGIAVQHAGFDLQVENRQQADPLPTRVQLGATYRVELPTPPEAEPTHLRVLLDLQDAWGSYRNPEVRLGMELVYGDVVQLRGGYAFLHSESRGPSIGAGLQFGRLTLDFARVFFASGTFDEPVYLSVRARL